MLIFYILGSSSIFIFIFFPITALWNSWKCNVIPTNKKIVALTKSFVDLKSPTYSGGEGIQKYAEATLWEKWGTLSFKPFCREGA